MVGQAEDRYLAADRVTHGGVEEYAASAGGGHGSPGRGCGSPMCSRAGDREASHAVRCYRAETHVPGGSGVPIMPT